MKNEMSVEEFVRRLEASENPERAPLDVLRELGLEIPPEESLSDADLPSKLMEMIEGAAELGIVFQSTDHLSDRELYRLLTTETLVEPMLPAEDDALADSFIFIDILGGWSAEDMQVYLRYYADEETRAEWAKDDPELVLPPREKPPYDRDRTLPGAEG